MDPALRAKQPRNAEHADGRRVRDGRGEFYGVEPYRDRTILVRFVFIPLTADSARSEQAFSQDGGATWETNWINNYSRSR